MHIELKNVRLLSFWWEKNSCCLVHRYRIGMVTIKINICELIYWHSKYFLLCIMWAILAKIYSMAAIFARLAYNLQSHLYGFKVAFHFILTLNAIMTYGNYDIWQLWHMTVMTYDNYDIWKLWHMTIMTAHLNMMIAIMKKHWNTWSVWLYTYIYK